MNKILNNTQIETVIVEDELKSLHTLQGLLERYCPEIHITGTARSVKEGLIVIPEKRPELIFMDIAMPDGDAFDLLNNLDKVNFETIFITAYNEFALKAFNFSALHYLLKPVNQDDLKDAVHRYLRIRGNLQINERMQILNQSLQNNYAKISLPTNEGLIILEVDKIIRIEASSNYCQFFLNDKKTIIVSKPLSHFEKTLEEVNFIRVHNTHMINLMYVQKYNKGRGGSIILKDGTQISVSASRKKDFLDQLNQVSVRIK
ncbi:MAG: response regulator transcription factor [Bacteroidales bacterium]|nr:response regulator transcription factor [Bacteroidales bacterium]